MGQRDRLTRVAAAVAALGILAAGCGDGDVSGDAVDDGQASAPTSTSTPETSAKPTSKRKPAKTATATTTPTNEDAEPGKTRLCASGDLKLSLGRGSAGAGTAYRPLRFTNTSGTPCEIQGFPGVSYVAGDDGHQVGKAAFRDGTKGDPVTLDRGETAYAPVAFVQVRNYDEDECEPTKVRGLRVYPPQETNSMYVPNEGTGCANENMSGFHLKVRTIEPGQGPG